MDFNLTEERQMLQDTLRRYLREQYGTARRNDILASDTGFSADIWAELADLGVLGALFTEDMGGFGGAGFDIAVVFEELGRAGVVEPILDSALLGGRLLAAAGKTDFVEQVIGGALHLAVAHGEPDGRYDLDHVNTTATDGKLTGRKAVVMNAEAADHMIVSAKDGDTIALYLVDKGAQGLDIQGYPLLAGGRAAEVTLDNTPGDPLGLTLEDYEAANRLALIAQCAEALGAMETATALTKDYLMTRKQFGRPIGTFQALAHRMSDLLIELEQARSAVINAAGYIEDKHADMHLSASKNLIGRIGRLVAEEAIQMHGGIAMTQEYELAHIAKRIVMADHRFGDTDYHLERFIALSAA
ncbi:acyl-CoA dehydrogenase family protein [Tateyamaria omphalii]|uniref:Pimeloyl-CoA dehydrogenase small subunit n=1 Tax=Tateyamaria omphalii TaxID=299262 RepID=A0A1P8MQP8_9RHOB|nr:acyl-CoA dehydrogenase [Tateyamaria omphalii]APX10342.1 pimeloyl-CoA dehydrogenase small subunit [Tateyamaria omphalii]